MGAKGKIIGENAVHLIVLLILLFISSIELFDEIKPGLIKKALTKNNHKWAASERNLKSIYTDLLAFQQWPELQSISLPSNEYWWVRKVRRIEPEVETTKADVLYADDDQERDRYPSSYIGNPKLSRANIFEIRNPDNTILLMERKSYSERREHPTRYCLFADGTVLPLDESEALRLKDW